MEPLTMAMAAAGLIKGFADSANAKRASASNLAMQLQGLSDARRTGQDAVDFQQQNLSDALAQALGLGTTRVGEATRGAQELKDIATATRSDQFGNKVVYDPTTKQFQIQLTPEQQLLVNQGEERQRLAGVRGAQASEDYARERAGYLYNRPENEDQIRAEIANLITQSRGTGEQQLRTLANRFRVRTEGNVPTLQQPYMYQTAGQELADTMLKARAQALQESGTREQQHAQRYLPAMKQFESTANTVASIDPTGAGVSGMSADALKTLLGATDTGQKNILAGLADMEKQVPTVSLTGGRNVGTAYDQLLKSLSSAYSGVGSAYGQEGKAATTGPGVSDFLKIATLMQNKDKGGGSVGGTTGGTKGVRFTSTGEPITDPAVYGATGDDPNTIGVRGPSYYTKTYGPTPFEPDPYTVASSPGMFPSTGWQF